MSGEKVGQSSSPEDLHRLSVLRDLYEGLLPPRQREVIAMKLDEDLSLAEMAERLGVSRQACEDAFKRAERALLETEQRIGMLKRVGWDERCAAEIESLLFGMTRENWPEVRELALRLLRALREGGEAESGV